MTKKFTLVSTVFNEISRIHQTISDLSNQTCLPAEIIITDAGSTDGTYEALLTWKAQSKIPVKIISKKGCNVAEGRNLAIKAASYQLIASTDFGCRFHPQWLESIITPFNDPAVKVVGGSYSVEEKEQDSLAARAAYILSDGYQIDVNASWFIPSSRSIAYMKEVFDAVGGYPEWLTLAGDDMVFGKEILARGYKFYLVDKPYVFWGRHKKARGYVKEANRYGLADGEAKLAFEKFLFKSAELLLRYLFFAIFLTVIIFFKYFKTWQVIVTMVLFAASLRSYLYYFKNWLKFRSPKYNLKVLLYGFYFIDINRWSYSKGYLKGYFTSSPARKKEAGLLKERLALGNAN